jgi:hypothetical protein
MYYLGGTGELNMAKESDIKGLVDKLKAGERGEKENITFRLSKRVVCDFKKACEKEKVKPGATVEELMLLFIAGTK